MEGTSIAQTPDMGDVLVSWPHTSHRSRETDRREKKRETEKERDRERQREREREREIQLFICEP
jgi:hypothetical protein